MYFCFLMILPGVIDCEANTQISMKIFKVLKCSVDRFSKGNLIVSVMVFFSINTFEKIARYFDIADVQWITKTSYYAIQKKSLAGVVHLDYFRIKTSLVRGLKVEGEIKMSVNGKHDSPTHDAKYVARIGCITSDTNRKFEPYIKA